MNPDFDVLLNFLLELAKIVVDETKKFFFTYTKIDKGIDNVAMQFMQKS